MRVMLATRPVSRDTNMNLKCQLKKKSTKKNGDTGMGKLEAATLKTGYTTPKQRREDNAWKVEGTTDTGT